jgi:hypothetical protein
VMMVRYSCPPRPALLMERDLFLALEDNSRFLTRSKGERDSE